MEHCLGFFLLTFLIKFISPLSKLQLTQRHTFAICYFNRLGS